MISPMRTIIDLPQNQVDALAIISDREGLSRAELIRQAIALYLDSCSPEGEDAFGLWKGRALDGRDYEDELRAEWQR